MSTQFAIEKGSSAASARSVLPDRAERRQLTLLFCDLVDSVVLSTRLDPEDLRDLISTYQLACVEAVRRYEGYVARYVGDGVLIYFGYPTAHEDNAERAICAGLEIVAAVGRLRDGLDIGVGSDVRVRVGIATGDVVVGDAVAEGVLDRNAVVGEAANLAARLQSMAQPNSIVVAELTRQLAGERFAYRDLGRQELKGFAHPVPAFEVIERREVTRLQARGGALTPLVGREEEITLMLNRWEYAVSGKGQVFALIGPPGIGKSRITAEFMNRISNRSASAGAPIVLQYSPYHSNAPLYPVIGYFARITGISPEDVPAVKLAKLARMLGDEDSPPRRDVALIADLLGVEPDEFSPARFSPSVWRELTIEAIANHFMGRGRRDPVVIVFEDAQWIDPTSKLLLARLVDLVRDQSGFVVITARTRGQDGIVWPDAIADWVEPCPDHITMRDIRELPPVQGRRLANAMAASDGIDTRRLEALLAKSGGIPLYIEELVKAAAEGFEGPTERRRTDQNVVPHTISDALMAQLDRLENAKEVAQHASVIGQEFPLDLLAEAMQRRPETLIPLLDRLIEAGILAAAVSTDAYRFKHALIRDIAYASLLRKNRRPLHCEIARALSRQAPARANNDLIAQHYSRGAAHQDAIEFWRRGAAQAIARSANEEANAMLNSALAELQDVRAAQQPPLELELILAQAMALRSVRGYSATEVEERLGRARELCAVCGDAEKKFSVEWGLFQCTMVKGDINGAQARAASLLDLAGNEPGPARVDAFLANGMIAFNAGEFEAAARFHEAGVEMSRPEVDEPRYLTHGQNAGLFCLSYLARTQCVLGELDRGRATIQRALRIAVVRARHPGHTHGYLNAAIHAVRVHHLCEDLPAEQHFAEAVVEVARRNHYAYYEAVGLCHLGWITGATGDVERGVAILQEAMTGLSDTGTFLSVPGFHLLLAQLYLKADKLDEARRSLVQAVGSDGFALWDADIQRVRGDMLARQAPVDWYAVEGAYRASLEIARRQGAGLLICKAGVSLAHLLATTARAREAYELLWECLTQLHGGEDHVVAQQARHLLQEVAAKY